MSKVPLHSSVYLLESCFSRIFWRKMRAISLRIRSLPIFLDSSHFTLLLCGEEVGREAVFCKPQDSAKVCKVQFKSLHFFTSSGERSVLTLCLVLKYCNQVLSGLRDVRYLLENIFRSSYCCKWLHL